MTSLEGWGSAIELRPRYGSHCRLQHTGRPGPPAARRCSVPPYPPDSRRADGPRSRAMPCRQTRVPGRERVGFACRTGCSAAWLARLLWEQEAASSNLAIPTISAGQKHGFGCPAGFQDRLTVDLNTGRRYWLTLNGPHQPAERCARCLVLNRIETLTSSSTSRGSAGACRVGPSASAATYRASCRTFPDTSGSSCAGGLGS
jgi:hypothetical protein